MPEIQQNVRSEAVQDILTAVPSWMIRWGNTLLLLLLVLFILLSWLIKYPDTIQAIALVTTEVPPQKEYAQIGGKLKHILISNNDTVARSQDLAVIENTADYQDVLYLKSIIDTLTYSKERFDFPIHQIPLLFLGEMDDDYAIFENNYSNYDRNRKLNPFDIKRQNESLSQYEIRKRLGNLTVQQSIQQKELNYIRTDFDRHRELFEKGVISQQEFEQKKIFQLQAERNFKTVSNTIEQLRGTLISTSNSFKIEEGNQGAEDIRLLRNTIQSFNQLKKAIYDWEATYILRSETNGTVSFLNFWNINQQIKPDDLIFTIIPSNNKGLIAKLKIPALNSGKLLVGQKVYLELEKYPETAYGKLASTIHSISAVTDEDGNYLVDVLLDKRLITTYGKEIPFQSEMRGKAEVITEDLRLLERLFYKIRGIFYG